MKSAFPHPHGSGTAAGMTLRQYYAATVLQGIYASRSETELLPDYRVQAKVAKHCFEMADEMIAADAEND